MAKGGIKKQRITHNTSFTSLDPDLPLPVCWRSECLARRDWNTLPDLGATVMVLKFLSEEDKFLRAAEAVSGALVLAVSLREAEGSVTTGVLSGLLLLYAKLDGDNVSGEPVMFFTSEAGAFLFTCAILVSVSGARGALDLLK